VNSAEIEPAASPVLEAPKDPSMVELGGLIQRLRLEGGISIGTLAHSAGLSSGLVSQIERGLGNPSYTTLIKLAHALHVPVGKFFNGEEPDERVALVKKDERRRLLLSERDLVYELLTPSMNGKLGMLQAQIAPGWTNESVPYVHEGEECVTITEGELLVVIAGTHYYLSTGDSITYDSSVPHWYRNDTDLPAVLIGAMTPPSF
jgi:transcriptional regulator with XRE-family HTH domain